MIAKHLVHTSGFEIVVTLNKLLTELKNNKQRKDRKLTYAVLEKSLDRSDRTLKKDIKTLIIMWAPVFLHPLYWWMCLDPEYEVVLNNTVCMVLLNQIG